MNWILRAFYDSEIFRMMDVVESEFIYNEGRDTTPI